MAEQTQILTPAELKAVEDHKYYLSLREHREISIEEAVEDFLKHYAEAWQREKLRRDNEEQIKEIERHKYLKSKEVQRDIGRHAAAADWCAQYAHIWRQERESLERNGFVQISVQIQNKNGLHLRPTSKLALLAGKYDCDVYMHKPAGMEYYNFMLGHKPYINVKSILSMLRLGVIRGDVLEFIATGAQAQEALDALVRLIKSGDTD